MTELLTARLRSLSIRGKLAFIAIVTGGTALLVGGTLVTAVQIMQFRASMAEDFSTLARIVGSNSAGSVAFGDDESASEILSGLARKEGVTSACIYRESGALFASYPAKDAGCPAAAPPLAVTFGDDRLTVAEPIFQGTTRLGLLYLRSDLTALDTFVRHAVAVMFVVFLLAGAVAFALSARLQRLVSGPILHLADVIRAVRQEQTFHVRAEKLSEDEVGTLIDGFNGMLAEVERRDGSCSGTRSGSKKKCRRGPRNCRRERRPAIGHGQGRGRQPRQERVPGQHEPRNPHADERHHRHDGADARHRS